MLSKPSLARRANMKLPILPIKRSFNFASTDSRKFFSSLLKTSQRVMRNAKILHGNSPDLGLTTP
jgi:hypothetical protein